MSFLTIQNVTKTYANNTALHNVSFEIPKGKIFGLLGPNGAGKTTLIRIINQIIAPDKGEVLFNNEKLSRGHLANIGYLPEERGLYKKMKVGEQLVYLARLKGLDKTQAYRKIKYWFEKFEITSWWNKKIEELSKGMQQKIQFIATILHEPELLIFDEPFSGFDPINAQLLKDEILRLKENGASIIFSTHNMSSVEEICDNIALINKSQKVLEGPISDIKNQFNLNIFEVIFEKNARKLDLTLSADYKLLDVDEREQGLYVRLQLLKDYSSNDLLRKLMGYGNITSFQPQLPSMNDIFIEAVAKTNSNTIDQIKNQRSNE